MILHLHIKRAFLFLLFVVLPTLLGGLVDAQPIEFDHINRGDGLPNNSVTSIVQDKYGMMWFGTYNGLVRFDGYNYKIFVHDPHDSLSMPDNMVRSLKLTPQGDLLVINENYGFSIFNYETEKFTRYFQRKGEKGTAGINKILSAHVDKKGIVWFGTWDGLTRFDPVTKRMSYFRIKSNVTVEGELDFVSSIEETKEGKLLLYTAASRIIYFNPKTKTYDFVHFPELPKTKIRLNRGGILQLDNKGYLWVGTEFDGLFRMNLRSGAIKRYSVQNGKLASNVLMSVLQDSEGRLWVATDGGGLFLYDYRTDHFKTFQYDPYNASSISSNAVYSIYEDKDGHIWVGSYGAGLNIIKKNKRKFELYSNKGPEKHRLSYKSVLSFARADSGRMWVGTDGGGLNLFNPKDKTFEYINKSNSGICSNIIKSLSNDGRGNLWIGTYASGMCRANFKTNEFTTFTPFDSIGKGRLSHVNVWALQQDKKDSSVWIGLLDAGVDRYFPQKDSFEHFRENTKGLMDGSVMSSLVDSKNNVWMGTETGGLSLFDRKKNRFVTFMADVERKESLNANHIQAIMEDSKGRIWLGTKLGGLSMLVDKEKNIFKNYMVEDGLPSNTICGIEEDSHGNLWVSTDNGIFSFNPQTGFIRTFDKSDGLQSLEFTIGASGKDATGHIYFGGTDGFNRFHPDSILFNHSIPSVYISGINLFNKPIEPGVPHPDKVYFNKPIHFLDTLQLNYTDYVFSIEFTCTDYTSHDKNKFAYQLVGFDHDWSYVDATNRKATYTNLSPGTYVFKVKAANNDGVWNEKGTHLVIVVHPPWWQTLWFRFFLGAFLVTVLVAFYYIRLNQIRHRNSVLSKLVKHKTSELRGANEKLREQNGEIKMKNEQLEAQNHEILRKSSHIMQQQEEIIAQKNELEVKNTQLNIANATKDKLFSIVGHDLRNPVSALAALTDMLQSNYQLLGEKDRLQIVSHVQSSATSLKLLVNNLLDWALVQSDHLNPQPVIVEMLPLVEDCFRVLKLHAQSKGILLENQAREGHFVFADSQMVQTVIRNLVSNAIKFTPQGGKIQVETVLQDNDYLLIIVSDTGMGMDERKIEQLLARQKLNSTTGTSDEKGSGLGLVVVREFIEANQGRMEILSKVGHGTKFQIYLPMLSE